MAGSEKQFAVPKEFTPAEDGSLVVFLTENAACAIRVDLGDLRRLDTMLVELLLSAAATWAKRGLRFRVAGVSTAHEEVFMHLGIKANLLERGITA